jgi:hypothetical protein
MNKARTDIKLVGAWLLPIVLVNILNCSNAPGKNKLSSETKGTNAIGYNLSTPDKVIILPGILREISGITLIDSSTLACIQDENGIVFIFDLLNNEIKDQVHFHSNGDYEGITSVNSTLYVLRSDGVLFKIGFTGNAGSTKAIFSPGIPDKENEGLCYDQNANRLLIAPKITGGRTSEYEGKHPVYSFDLKSEVLNQQPAFDFDLGAIKKFASDKKILLPEQAGGQGLWFRPSAIGIHPLTNKLFLLSAMDKMLFVFNMNGTLEFMEKLNPEILYMPEGITFLKNGDMLISNEGKDRYPSLLRFNYMPK